MPGFRSRLMLVAALALCAAPPSLAAPEVITLGTDAQAADPVAACGDAAASAFEDGRDGHGVEDGQIFLGGAVASCEAALAAMPDSAAVKTWLARTYLLVGRRDAALALLESAIEDGNAFAAYLLAGAKLAETYRYGAEEGIALLALSADAGFAPAQADLAGRYETGDGVDFDSGEAMHLYQLAADRGHAGATYKLGTFYHGAFGTPPDYARATALYTRAVELGEPMGYNGLGQLHEFGQGVPEDFAEAARLYQLGADAGEKMSQTALAYLYEQGLGVAQDFDRSFALLTDAAAQNWGFAQAALSIHYLFGQGTAIDESKAFDLATQAVLNNVVYADGILGYLYAEGIGTYRDLTSALRHFEAGAQYGDPYSTERLPMTEAELACQRVAGDPHEGSGYAPGVSWEALDPAAAIPACAAALEMNPSSSGDRVWLGRAYAKAARLDEAVPLLAQGVDAGNPLAQLLYGDMLLSGAGVPEDPVQAIALYEAAAEQNFAPAQYGVGRAYAEGWGVAVDPAAALAWFRKALDNGMREAEADIARLEAGPVVPIDMTGFGREGPGY